MNHHRRGHPFQAARLRWYSIFEPLPLRVFVITPRRNERDR